MAQKEREPWCAKGMWGTWGTNVQWRAILVGEHMSGVITESVPAANWLADRFAGRVAACSCWRADDGRRELGLAPGPGRRGRLGTEVWRQRDEREDES
ncbi:hypothetical protein [Streptomyces sp. NPDC000880]